MDWDARGMHVHLLNISTQEDPPGTIPNDMAAITRWLGSPSDDTWRRVRPQIFAAWTLRGERWVNPGMERTFDKRANYAARPQNGTISVPYENDNALKNVYIGLSTNLDSSKSESKPSKKKKVRAKPPPFVLPDWIPKELWDAFEEMRVRKKAPMTDHARKLKVRDLTVYRAQGFDVVQMIEKSVSNSWTDIYPPKNGTNGETKHDGNREAISRISEGLYGPDGNAIGGGLLEFSTKGKP